MLRNMKVGTKLLAVVLPPLLVLVVVAGLGAQDRRAEASDAQGAEEYIALTADGNSTISALQRERLLSSIQATSPTSAVDLAGQRAATDQAIADFRATSDGVDAGTELASALELTASRLDDISTIRDSVDRGSIDPLIVDQWYVDSIEAILDADTAVSNEVPIAEVSADLSSSVALARANEAVSKQNNIVTIALGQQEFDAEGRLWRLFFERGREADRYYGLYFELATAQQQAAVRCAQASEAATNVTRFTEPVIDEIALTVDIFDGILKGTSTVTMDQAWLESVSAVPQGSPATLETWVGMVDGQMSALDAPYVAMLDSVSAQVSDVRSAAEQQALLYVVLTLVAIVVSGILALVVARRITKPLRSLTEAADRLSTEQLPALVERLKSPGASTGEVILEPINMDREDEIGHLADAFDAIQRVTVEVAEEQQSLLKKGIGDIFVNLARRNQSLLDRQIEFIDQLESQEEDPDVLEDLFKLDHLATRMRRNAESLLVLAGVETTNRRARPVALADVVRVAVGEVEDFARLNLVSLDDSVVTGSAAMDVAHLLSELMENATAFSPPETTVEVLGHLNNDGSYVLSISDQGIGMSDEQFTDTNRLLAEPPLVGLTLSRSLGFTVVGRLAARFDIEVRLTSSPTGGVTALVTLPARVLEQAVISVEPDPQPAVEAAPLVDYTQIVEPAPVVEETIEPDPAPVASEADLDIDVPFDEEPHEWIPDAPAPSTLAGAVPEGAAFDAGLAALIGDDTSSNGSAVAAPDEVGGSIDAVPSLFGGDNAAEAMSQPEPVRTAAGLVKRVPRASAPATETTERPTGDVPVARTQRSPEEVRAMLSRYRSGLHRGRDGESSNGSSLDGAD
jgi:signal transduction histidine kinase